LAASAAAAFIAKPRRLRLVLALPASHRAAGRGRLLAPLAARLQGDPAGAPFFFRLGAPHKAIAGYGFFARSESVPVWLAWESFGDLNGNDTIAEMTARIEASTSLASRKASGDSRCARVSNVT
jgi:hypothetical protein